MGLPVVSPDRNCDVLKCEQRGEGEEGESQSEACTRIRPSAIKKRRKGKKRLWINLTNCKYESVRRAARRYGLREAAEGEDWTLFWTDCSVSLHRVKDMKRYQKINHFPGMNEICRKDLLARNMNHMLKLFPKDYNIFPQTWCLPADYSDFQAYTRAKKHKTYICKPDTGCQGKGIFITRSSKDVPAGEHMICQVYISRPFIIDRFKFDLRIYVLVTSCDPFSVFMFKEGLARFCTTQYNEPTHGNVKIRQQLQELRLKQEQKERDQRGGRRRDLQGETAGERVKPRRAQTQAPVSHCDPRPPLLPRVSEDPEAADVQAEKEEEEEAAADVEEQQRVDALLQRKKLLQDLGVVEQIQQLLQGRTQAGKDSQRPRKQPRRQETKLDPLTQFPQRTKQQQQQQQQQPPCAQTSQQLIHVTQQRLLRPPMDQRGLNESVCPLHELESHNRAGEVHSTISTQRIHWSVGRSLDVWQESRRSSFSDTRLLSVSTVNPPAALQSLLVISRAPLVRRPGFSHARGPQHGKGQ
nr:PREDICTED: tubulin polyglutamylase ttll6-like [Paralichthys olivaceus]